MKCHINGSRINIWVPFLALQHELLKTPLMSHSRTKLGAQRRTSPIRAAAPQGLLWRSRKAGYYRILFLEDMVAWGRILAFLLFSTLAYSLFFEQSRKK